MTYVLKFGGTSLATSERILKSARIASERARERRTLIVVSALGGVTNRLVQWVDGAGTPSKAEFHQLIQHHREITDEAGLDPAWFREVLSPLFDELYHLLGRRPDDAEEQRAWRDEVLSFGERISARIFTKVLRQQEVNAHPYDAHHFVRTDQRHGEARVDEDATRELIRGTFEPANGHVPVVTGFIGSSEQQRITTLGRSGSDYTAGLLAAALDADHLEIWTDTDGVLTADPKIVPTARTINELNYQDIEELARHGAKVVHPKTVLPLHRSNIPVSVKNSFNIDHPGTFIAPTMPSNGHFRSITVRGPYAQLHQPIDPYSDQQQLEIPEEAVVEHYKRSDHREWLIDLEKVDDDTWTRQLPEDLSRTAPVYQLKFFHNATTYTGDALAQALSLLHDNRLHPLFIDHSAQQRHFTLLLREEDLRPAARLLNDHLCLGKKKSHLFVAGLGSIGTRLLEQVDGLERGDLDVNILGACDSTRWIWDDQGYRPGELDKAALDGGAATDWDHIIDRLVSEKRRPLVFVDTTGSPDVAHRYPELLEQGIHVVTPSKHAGSAEQTFYNKLVALAEQHDVRWAAETTVGAGLPVLKTIRELRDTGDRIRSIEGVVSGSLNFILQQLEEGKPFSQAVLQAREAGYTEPDPRDDLSGEDVARKFMILARAAGREVERGDFEVEQLIPEALQSATLDEYLERLPEYDEEWQKRLDEVRAKGNTLRYVGRLTSEGLDIGLREVPAQSALGQLKGTENAVRLYTDRYNDVPLTIQGPGAGRDVTAAGVLADVLDVVVGG